MRTRHASVARLVAALLFLFAASCSGQSTADLEEARARGFDGSLESERFAIFWRTVDASADEVRVFLEQADVYWDRLAAIVGASRVPDGRVVVVLGGSGQADDGSWRFPNVDRDGRVILFEYSGRFADHIVEFPHELVHAFRRHAGSWHSGFWEEGFAEAIATEISPEDAGFPRYGYPLEIAAGHLLAWGEYLPLADVRTRHREMGQTCQLQAYLERASFFRFLVQRRGVRTLVDLAYAPHEPSDAEYDDAYGATFEDLVSEWERELLRTYEALPDADAQARAYRSEPPIRARPICEAPEPGARNARGIGEPSR